MEACSAKGLEKAFFKLISILFSFLRMTQGMKCREDGARYRDLLCYDRLVSCVSEPKNRSKLETQKGFIEASAEKNFVKILMLSTRNR